MSAERGRIYGGPSVTGPAHTSATGKAELVSVRVFRAATDTWETVELKRPNWFVRAWRRLTGR